MIDQLNFIYEAGETRRFHTVPMLRDQNIADHSWHLALLAYTLYGQAQPGVTVQFLMACLTHDMAECKVGDLPAPAKRNMSEKLAGGDFRAKWDEMEQEILQPFEMDWEKFLTDEEKRRLKFCDALEGLFHCVLERQLGNKTIIVCYRNFRNYVGSLLREATDVPYNEAMLTAEEIITHREWDAFNHAQNQWSEACD